MLGGLPVSMNFYQELFTLTQPTSVHQVLDAIQPFVKDMEPLTAPGPNSLPPIFFFQSFWSMVGDDISMVIFNCLNNFHTPSKLNHPFITLIIKVKSLERIFEYRPTSFCNVLYKLVSKVVANQLKKVLPLIVFEN